MRSAFIVEAPLPYKHTFLIDDVVTTGATLAAAADALHRAGIAKITALTFAWGTAH
jgi:predicted amidophosphoribosyltransferase